MKLLETKRVGLLNYRAVGFVCKLSLSFFYYIIIIIIFKLVSSTFEKIKFLSPSWSKIESKTGLNSKVVIMTRMDICENTNVV